MTKKVLMVMTLVGCLVAWSSLALATAVDVTLNYSATAYAENPSGTSEPDDLEGPGGVAASVSGAQASVTAPKNSYLLYADCSVFGAGRYAEAWADAELAFKAPAEKLSVSFDYEMFARTNGNSDATAWLAVFLFDYSGSVLPKETVFNASVNASSDPGTSPSIPSQSSINSSSFSKTLDYDFEVDRDYFLLAQVNWVYANTLTSTSDTQDAEAYAGIKNFQFTYGDNNVDPPVVDPPSAPVPGTLILLVTGLLGLAGLRRARKS